MRRLDRFREEVLDDPRALLRRIADQFSEHDLTVLASAIAFRLLAALVPGLLFFVALLGVLDLESFWRQELAPDLQENVSSDAFRFINNSVLGVLGKQELLWLTVGAAFVLFQTSSVARAVTRGVNRLYGVSEERSTLARIIGSLGVGAMAGSLILGGIILPQIGELAIERELEEGPAVEVLGFLARWVLGGLLVGGGLLVVLRGAPRQDLAPHRLTTGIALILAAWLAGSVLFALYLEYIATFATVFGNLATVFVLIEYLFGLAVVLLAGLALDATVARERGLMAVGESDADFEG